MANKEHSWDVLSDREALFVDQIIRDLDDIAWAQPLLTTIKRNGGLTPANKTIFFELRFGYALYQAGIVPRYEVPGQGQSTLDFGFTWSGRDWLVELMRLEETQAVQSATQVHVDQDGVQWASLQLSTDAEDPTQSPEGETLKAVQRICQKCERDGRPSKFPVPKSAHHVILVDFRTFLDGSDNDDLIHVARGGEYVRNEARRMRWDGQLISGVFNERTPLRGAREARERVHLLGFVRESDFAEGGFAAGTRLIPNPYLFASAEDARAVIAAWPLHPRVLNCWPDGNSA